MADLGDPQTIHTRLADTKRVLPRLLEQGGRPLPETCRGELVVRTRTDYPQSHRGAGGHTSGCGLPARAAIPYSDHKGADQVAVVCAVCDAAPRFPRLQTQAVGSVDDADKAHEDS